MVNSLRILGCYSGTGGYGRYPSSQYLIINNKSYLIDCGEGTQFLLKKYKIKFSSIDNIFISHLHGDHYFGLPGLISYYNLKGRVKDLNIYGPKGLKKIITLMMKSGKSWTSYNLNFHELEYKNTEIINNDEILVKTLKLKHRIPCTGFLFQSKKISDISYAYCSDTAYNEELSLLVKDVNILYHESTFLSLHKDLAVKTKHSTAIEAGKIASKANVSKLILGHFSSRYHDLNEFKKESSSVFKNTFIAEEGKIYSF